MQGKDDGARVDGCVCVCPFVIRQAFEAVTGAHFTPPSWLRHALINQIVVQKNEKCGKMELGEAIVGHKHTNTKRQCTRRCLGGCQAGAVKLLSFLAAAPP